MYSKVLGTIGRSVYLPPLSFPPISPTLLKLSVAQIYSIKVIAQVATNALVKNFKHQFEVALVRTSIPVVGISLNSILLAILAKSEV